MTRSVDISPHHLKVVREILRKNLPPGVAAWVFGGRANWMMKDSSDLDLALECDLALDYGTIAALDTAFEESDLSYNVGIIDLNQVSYSLRSVVETKCY